MKLIDSEKVDGTEVTIGRRVQFRTVNGQRVERPSTYTATYKDVDGRWRQDGLGTTNKREARRMAIQIQLRIEQGKGRPVPDRVHILPLIDRYETFCRDKGLAPKSLAKYRADLLKLRTFVTEQRLVTVPQFDTHAFYRFRQWLDKTKHKQGLTYAPKSVYATLTVTKQVFKWAWKEGLTPEYRLASVSLPTAKAKPQPCFTTAQVETVIGASTDPERTAYAILAYSGMRVGELEQLQWIDVLLNRGELGMFHIRRGGSAGTTKDKDERFVPIHPRIRSLVESLSQSSDRVMPTVTERRLLARLKAVCKASGLSTSFKLHSFRHHFASLCANHHVAYRKALAWLGHSSSDILDLYYHLHDDESEAAMKALGPVVNRER